MGNIRVWQMHTLKMKKKILKLLQNSVFLEKIKKFEEKKTTFKTELVYRLD